MSHGLKSSGADRNGGGLGALGASWSGRRFVIVAVLGLATAWGVLYLVFLDWRARHRALADEGERRVATLVDPLARLVPPGVEPKPWRAAVADTHAMLAAVAASGHLGRKDLEALEARVRLQVGRTTPESAVAELSRLWDRMEAEAGPILTGRPSRPPFPPRRPKLLGGGR